MEDANERKARLKALRAAAREEEETAAATAGEATEEPQVQAAVDTSKLDYSVGWQESAVEHRVRLQVQAAANDATKGMFNLGWQEFSVKRRIALPQGLCCGLAI